MQLTDYEHRALEKLYYAILEGKWSNDGLVELIKLVGDGFLNIKTIPDYAKFVGKSYPGVVKKRQVTEIFNVKFIIDNE